MAKLLAPPSKNAVQKALAAQLLNTATTGDPITFDDVDGIPNLPGVLVIRRVDGAGVATPSYREYIEYSGTSGTTVLITTRNVDGSNSALTHPVGSIVEFIPDVTWADRIYDALSNVINPATLAIDTTKVPVAPGTSGNILTSDGTNWTSATPASSGGASYWTDVPGTPTRVSDTQFTITDTANADKYDTLFTQGVELRWLESSTVNTAKVRNSSYGTNTVTVNLVGDSLTAGFTAMKYATPTVVADVDGWTADIDTWVYASASTFTIAGVDRTTTFTPGTRLKFTQTTAKYAVVASSSFSTNTTVTIAVNTNYTIANAAITSPYYSYQANPQGYPGWFNFSPSETWTNPPTSRTTYCKYAVNGRVCTMLFGTNGTANGSNSSASVQLTIPIPLAAVTITRQPMLSSNMWTDNATFTEFGTVYATATTGLFSDWPTTTRKPTIVNICAQWEI